MDMGLMDTEGTEDFEEQAAVEEGEGQNRAFIIAVAAMSAILLVGVLAFCAWILYMGGYIGGAAEATPTVDSAAVAALTQTAIAQVTETEEILPTETPRPTETPTLAPTDTPIAPEATATTAPDGGAQVTPTPSPTATASPTAPADAGVPQEVADTGIGSLTAPIAALALLVLMVAVRGLRTGNVHDLRP
jgi:hypothetical protein